jgi:serine/threonine-protein kinase
MAGADLRDRSFSNQNLSGRDLRRADLRGTDLSGANLQRSDLRGVVFNTPQPKWLRTFSWIFGKAKTLGQVLAGLAGLFIPAVIAFTLIYRFTAYFWLGGLGALGALLLAWSVLWSITGRVSLGRYHADHTKRYTSLRKADLRGAQMEEKLRHFARLQGAILD